MCKWCELVIAIVILVFALWQTIYSQWIIVIAAVLLAIHSFMKCKCCNHKEMQEARPSRKRRR